MAALILWLCIGGVAYTYAGYPLAIAALARWAGRSVRKGPVGCGFSVVMAAHNEAARLPAKVRSILAARGVGSLVEVLIGSDGSTDQPGRVVEELGDPRVRVVSFPEQRGKPAVLNDLMAQARGEIVVMMDARQEVDPGVFEALLANFADATVGVVSGELVFRTSAQATATAHGMDAYWRYEKWLRRQEARFRSVPGATGAVYAVRRALYRPLAAETLLDDVAVPMNAIRQGYRCVFESDAVVFDHPSVDLAQEATRKRRTLAGSAQLVQLLPWVINPRQNPIWFEFVSHKLLRLAVPWMLTALLAANLALAHEPFYRALLAGQALFYALAAAGWLAAHLGRRGGWWSVPYLFLSLNAVTLLAVLDVVLGRTRVTWSRKAASR